MIPVSRLVRRQGDIVPCGWTNLALTCTQIDGNGKVIVFEEWDGCHRDNIEEYFSNVRKWPAILGQSVKLDCSYCQLR